MAPDPPQHAFADQAAWRAWLAAQHVAHPDGIWLKIAKKASGIASVTYQEALDVALCFGWIDGKVQSIDEAWFRQRFLPRRPRSTWSKRNVARVQELIAAGAMRAPGLAEITRAQEDGRWDAAYDGPATALVPDDLVAALDATPAARAAWDGLDGRNRYAILFTVGQAKRADTRARRIARHVAMLAAGERPHP